jgi:hypothetical protein
LPPIAGYDETDDAEPVGGLAEEILRETLLRNRRAIGRRAADLGFDETGAGRELGAGSHEVQMDTANGTARQRRPPDGRTSHPNATLFLAV